MPLLVVAKLAILTVHTVSAMTSSRATITQLIQKIGTLTLPKQRAVAACVGACVADAAARPFHWLYDGAKLESILGETNLDVAFFPESCSPYYTLPTGHNSCYYDLGYTMLESLVAVSLDDSGRLMKEYKENLNKRFGHGTEYNQAFLRRNEQYDPAKRYESREPIVGPWQQSSVTAFLTNKGNPSSKETDGLVSTLPVIAKLSSEGRIGHVGQELIREMAAILSTNVFALTHTLSAAIILNSVIQTGQLNPAQVLETVKNEIDDNFLATIAKNTEGQEEEIFGCNVVMTGLEAVVEAVNKDPTGSDYMKLVLEWGKPCANPGSFKGAIHAALTSQSFAEGTRRCVRAGGCNCSRANLAGSLLGARFGLDESLGGIPIDWIVKSDKAEAVLRLSLELFSK